MVFIQIATILFITVWLILLTTYNWFDLFWFYLSLIGLVMLILITTVIANPEYVLYLYNYCLSSDNTVFYNKNLFPTSKLLEANWETIRDEYYGLSIDKNNLWSRFSTNNKEHWKGWNTVVLRSFGHDNKQNMMLCPILSNILKSDPNITTAIFSILEPNKTLHSHYGPFKGVLRYHLGIDVPTDGECFISVNGQTYDWKNGEGVLFDETYKHFATNQTSKPRVILFLDVKRPNLSWFKSMVNDFLIYLIGNSPYNI